MRGQKGIGMQIVFWITVGILFAMPEVIAYKRKCKDRLKIAKLGFFLSWTVIGWVVCDGLGNMGKIRPGGIRQGQKAGLFPRSPLRVVPVEPPPNRQ